MPDLSTVATIEVAGRPIPADVVSHVRIRRAVNSAGHLQVRVDTSRFDPAGLVPGKPITVQVSVGGGAYASLFEGAIAGVGLEIRYGRRDVVLDAYDKASKLMTTANFATAVETKPDDVIRAIADKAGLSAEIESLSKDALTLYHQRGTMADTLDELCRLYGAYWYVDGSSLVVRQYTSAPEASGVTLRADALREFSARFSTLEHTGDLTVHGWDPVSKQTITGRATSGDASPAFSGEPRIVSTRASTEVARVWAPLVGDQSSATVRAKAVRTAAVLRDLTGHGECADVEPKLLPGTTVTIEQLGEQFSGAYRIGAVEHVMTPDRSFVTRFTIGGPEGAGMVDLLGSPRTPSHLAPTTGLTIGLVTNVEDPDNLNRVRVKFPYLDESSESAWARLVAPGAGKDRGLLVMPEVNDEVLVGFENGDLQRPFVLGGLWNGVDTAPLRSGDKALVDGGKVHRRVLATRVGHRIELSDESGKEEIRLALAGSKGTVAIHAKDGITVDAAENALTIKAANGQAAIEITKSGAVTIKAASLTIDCTSGDLALKGVNVTAESKANVQLTAKALLKGSGNIVMLEGETMAGLKGKLVQVN